LKSFKLLQISHLCDSSNSINLVPQVSASVTRQSLRALVLSPHGRCNGTCTCQNGIAFLMRSQVCHVQPRHSEPSTSNCRPSLNLPDWQLEAYMFGLPCALENYSGLSTNSSSSENLHAASFKGQRSPFQGANIGVKNNPRPGASLRSSIWTCTREEGPTV
jgi:hypothetical protein